jgi:glycosyltransferase involved in cell wall biosynthesis
MKLAIVTRYFPPDVLTGRETVIYNLWRQARNLDDVRLIAGWQRSRTNLPSECLAIDQSSSNRLINYARFFAVSALYLRYISPDVILSNAIELGPTGVSTATIVHDLNFGHADFSRGSQYYRHMIMKWRLSLNSRVIAVSQTTAEKLDQLGIPSSKINVINNGVDLDLFTAKKRTKKEGKFRITYPARFVHGKGQHVAIEAVRQLSPGLRRNIKLVLVGYAQDQTYLDRIRSKSEGLPVEIHQDVEDMVPFYQDSDVIIFPTIMEEGFGYTAAEALSCGKAVIYSDYPAIHEATGGIGVAVPPGDASALVEAIEKLFKDEQMCHALAQEGHAYAQKYYDWTNIYQKYRRILETIAN